MLAAEGLTFSYKGSATPVVHGVNLSLEPGEFVSLLGPSGCGKSTVLRLLSGLLEPDKGAITWQRGVKPRMGFVFQDAALMPWATVAENVLLPRTLKPSGMVGATVEELLEQVDLAGLQDRYPAALSGGQQMRVSIARALASSPELLLMDEPFAALDEILRFQMNELMLQLREEQGFAGLFVTHSLYEAAYLSDRIYVLGEGTIRGEVQPGLDRTLPAEEQRASPAYTEAVKAIGDLLAREDA